MKRRKFCLVYPTGRLGTMELHKELGMIPRTAASMGFDAELACYARSGVPRRWEGVRVRSFSRGPTLPFLRAAARNAFLIMWFALVAGTFDAVVIVHSSRISLLLAKIYRKKNNDGFLFFKSDLSTAFLSSIESSLENVAVFRELVSLSSVTGVETSAMLAEAKRVASANGENDARLRLMPNGFDAPETARTPEGGSRKGKTILYVGYIGTEAKNSELLLESFVAVANTGWTLVLVGPVADGFKARLEDFTSRYPSQVVVAGPVMDKPTLFGYYRDARVFCLTSRWESFCFSLLEAACFDDYIVSTDVGVARDLIADGAAGILCEPNSADFGDAMRRAISRFDDPRFGVDNSAIRAKYSWRSILEGVIR